jgi:hypothetical protein
MGMRAENLRAFRTDRPVAKCGSFGGTRNDADVLGHTPILREIVSVSMRSWPIYKAQGRGAVAIGLSFSRNSPCMVPYSVATAKSASVLQARTGRDTDQRKQRIRQPPF